MQHQMLFITANILFVFDLRTNSALVSMKTYFWIFIQWLQSFAPACHITAHQQCFLLIYNFI